MAILPATRDPCSGLPGTPRCRVHATCGEGTPRWTTSWAFLPASRGYTRFAWVCRLPGSRTVARIASRTGVRSANAHAHRDRVAQASLPGPRIPSGPRTVPEPGHLTRLVDAELQLPLKQTDTATIPQLIGRSASGSGHGLLPTDPWPRVDDDTSSRTRAVLLAKMVDVSLGARFESQHRSLIGHDAAEVPRTEVPPGLVPI